MKKIIITVCLLCAAITAAHAGLKHSMYGNNNIRGDGGFATPLAWSDNATRDARITAGAYLTGKNFILDDALFSTYEQAPAALTSDNFTMVVIPDMQNMVKYTPTTDWQNIYEWVVDNATAWNTAAALTVGDISYNADNATLEIAHTGLAAIRDAGIPVLPILGNHDYDGGAPATRPTTAYNRYFGADFFTGQSWYGGAYDSTRDNYYILVTEGEFKFLILGLEFFPRDEVLAWAQTIIDQYADRAVIVATHAIIDEWGALIQPQGACSPAAASVTGNAGPALWDFIASNKRIFLTVCGHTPTPPYVSHVIMPGAYGQASVIVRADWQSASYGQGYFVRLKFIPATRKIRLDTYSRTTGASDARVQSREFTLWPPITPVPAHDHGGMLGWREVGVWAATSGSKTFTLDPAAYKVKIEFNIAGFVSGTFPLIYLNSDTTADNYATTIITQDGTSVSAAHNATHAGIGLDGTAPSGWDVETWAGEIECYAAGSGSTHSCKGITSINNPDNTDSLLQMHSAVWRSTDHIKTVTLTAGSGLIGDMRVYEWMRLE